ncbi:MAG: hypothetical protein IAX21_01655 [Candidatus Bathyarchaeota archaeon]|nr:KEOPS complex subunit Cgi121 [Candidatus Bathyarchaeum tardum]WGM90317.1 MAG: KEOPS complex subunit Cgi121 [Candidatus Bathyarchaeum tardum]WNZ29602.1 MAG: hypothetical protein IAX21_01655 [Candidatus Bathyarchaeota archaeon]
MTPNALENEKIAILGFRDVKIDNIPAFLEQLKTQNSEVTFQLFDAKNIAGPQHLYFAAVNALNTFAKKTNISNNLQVEALLFASAQRQITKAVEMLGIKKGTSEIAALIFVENENQKTDAIQSFTKLISGKRDDSIISLTNEKTETIKKLFEISELEFNACLKKESTEKETLVDLVIERMALLVTKG